MSELSQEAMKDAAEQPLMQPLMHPSADLIALLEATHQDRQQRKVENK